LAGIQRLPIDVGEEWVSFHHFGVLKSLGLVYLQQLL
jgi:hypothetical protein